jgi:hypothetical protein
MSHSRGSLYFHRLFTVGELGLGQDPEPFVNRLIREFLKIGEAVAARWIELPHGILIFQVAPERDDSGAIYLYDRKDHVFYMVGFDGPDDNLTLAEFNQLLDEYGLLKYAETPSLVAAHAGSQEQRRSRPDPLQPAARPKSWEIALPLFTLAKTNPISTELPMAHAVPPCLFRGRCLWLQSPGSA